MPLEPPSDAALPLLARGSRAAVPAHARLRLAAHENADALVSRKDPQEYLRRLKFHRSIRSATEYGLEERAMTAAKARRGPSTRTAPAPGIPGPGGWGAILISGRHRKELSGGEAVTTNNRMELMTEDLRR